jgi:hypothetical protein
MSGVVERLLALGDVIAASLAPLGLPRTVAYGWATVELDRAVAQLAEELGLMPERFAIAPDCELLGARCRVAMEALPDGSSLAVLEPATEGRLAATLARLDEGPAAIWLVAANDLGPGGSREVASATSSEQVGPFGVERLVLGGPIHGPHLLLVDPPGTIPA